MPALDILVVAAAEVVWVVQIAGVTHRLQLRIGNSS